MGQYRDIFSYIYNYNNTGLLVDIPINYHLRVAPVELFSPVYLGVFRLIFELDSGRYAVRLAVALHILGGSFSQLAPRN